VVTKTLAPMSQDGRVWPRAEDFDGVVNLDGYVVDGYETEVPLSQLFQHLPVAVLRGKAEAAAKPKRKRALA
jgi:(1->4)-alpha-D-glucan 1-alpha-D-glucosylmutase